MTGRHHRVPRALAVAIAAASLCASCGMIDAACWAPFADEDYLCERIQRLKKRAHDACDASLPAPAASTPACPEIISCLVDNRHGCLLEWQTLWDCAKADEPSCSERSASGGFGGFCSDQLDAFYECVFSNSSYSSRYEVLKNCLGLCGNSVCDADLGEDANNCSQDCAASCEDGGCHDAGGTDAT